MGKPRRTGLVVESGGVGDGDLVVEVFVDFPCCVQAVSLTVPTRRWIGRTVASFEFGDAGLIQT